MSTVPPSGGIAAGAAGTSLSQRKGTDVSEQDGLSSAQQRKANSAEKAEAAAGIGETDGEDHEADERDADGRRLWEIPADVVEIEGEEVEGSSEIVQTDDTTGESGGLLDLSG